MTTASGRVDFDHISKRFGKVDALKDIDLHIEPGEFFTLLGPSGCGKTTLLRITAGLETPTNGTIRIDGQAVNHFSPGERDIAMVFQSYALYGHMTVYDNIAFPLRMVKSPQQEIDSSVQRVARRLQIDPLLDRKPGQLSGGQQQRVALARAIVREPRVFLLDEPLSNLDARLRLEMRLELKSLQDQLGVTSIYVTHDQEEAMTMSSRIAVFDKGRLLQVGTPEEIYKRPSDVQVARFVGTLPMNFFPLSVAGGGDGVLLEGENLALRPLPEMQQALRRDGVEEVLLGIRPQDIQLCAGNGEAADENSFRVEVFLVEPVGDYTVISFRLGESIYRARLEGDQTIRPGDPVRVIIPPQSTHIFDANSGRRVA